MDGLMCTEKTCLDGDGVDLAAAAAGLGGEDLKGEETKNRDLVIHPCIHKHYTTLSITCLVEGVGHEQGHAILRGGRLHARRHVHVRGEVGSVDLVWGNV